MAADVIIAALLVLVRHLAAQPEEVTRRLQGHSPPIRRERVQAVFQRFGLSGDGPKGGYSLLATLRASPASRASGGRKDCQACSAPPASLGSRQLARLAALGQR